MAISIAFIIVASLLLGSLLAFFEIPPLVGMLGLGIFLNRINWIDSSLLAIGTDLRMIALIIILLRAGFELSFDTLKRVGRSAILLSFLPALFEALTITFVGPIFLPLTYLESALLGCVLGAVSPAVVVPMMVGFIEEKRGTKKGIPTLVLAGASMDDVVVIVAFTALLGVYLGEQVNLTYAIASIPISIILGIGVGIGLGLILARLFERYNPRATKRALLILGLAILLVSSEPYLEKIHIPFAGFLSVMAIGFIILQKREAMAQELSSKFAKMWIFSELLLFVLVGAQVDIKVALAAGLHGALVLIIGLFVRSIGTFIATLGSDFTFKERLFIVIAYLPKATVQAALGGSTLLALTSRGLNPEAGEIILAVAVLSILLTAPLGSWAISWAGRKLLVQEVEE